MKIISPKLYKKFGNYVTRTKLYNSISLPRVLANTGCCLLLDKEGGNSQQFFCVVSMTKEAGPMNLSLAE